jgi:hypothetical protein
MGGAEDRALADSTTKPGEPQGEGTAAKDAGETRSHFVRDWIIDRLRASQSWGLRVKF